MHLLLSKVYDRKMQEEKFNTNVKCKSTKVNIIGIVMSIDCTCKGISSACKLVMQR